MLPKNRHLIASCTQYKKENTILYKCIQLNNSLTDYVFIENNKHGLSKNYNSIIEEYKNSYDFIHFVHDDVFIYDNLSVIDFVLTEYNYDISGVAGSKKISMKPPYLWHLMSQKNSSMGAVEHCAGDKSYLTFFGSTYDKCVIMDGVYMCVKTANLKNWKFNENFDFHFYDIASSIDAFKMKLNLGIVPIHIKHYAKMYNPLENESWKHNAQKFEQLYVR